MSAALDDTLARLVREQVTAALDETLPKYFGQTRLPPRQSQDPVRPAGTAAYISREDAAAMISKSKRTIGRYIADGKLRASGERRDRIAVAEIERLMAAKPAPADDVDEVVSRIFAKKKG